MTAKQFQTDIAIVGGGIAGLWLLNLLSKKGFAVTLLEQKAIGSDQTLASQGMIHGGIKYALGGLLTDASETIAAMPERWQDCLEGIGTLDLTGVETLSNDYFLFSDSRLTSRVTAFFGSKAIQGRVEAVGRNDAPGVLQHPDFKGLVYRLRDRVIDTGSLITRLSEAQADNIRVGPVGLIINNNQLEGISLDDHSSLRAQHYIFAAGRGNGSIIEQLRLPVSMQLRPLNQVILTGQDLPDLYAHAVSLKTIDKPRLTVTTHKRSDGTKAWYLGGQLAETGVARSDAEQIEFARAELDAIFPWLSFDEYEFSTCRIDRAEASQEDQGRPDTPYAGRFGNVMVCWPTKLTLTPLLGDMVLSQLDLKPMGTDARFVTPNIMGRAPWEHEA